MREWVCLGIVSVPESGDDRVCLSIRFDVSLCMRDRFSVYFPVCPVTTMIHNAAMLTGVDCARTTVRREWRVLGYVCADVFVYHQRSMTLKVNHGQP